MRLIVAVNSSVTNVAAKNALTAFLEAKGWSVWHWYDDLWLLDNVPNTLSLSELREEIRNTIPTISQVLIFSTEGLINHSGTVPQGSLTWFTEHWGRR